MSAASDDATALGAAQCFYFKEGDLSLYLLRHVNSAGFFDDYLKGISTIRADGLLLPFFVKRNGDAVHFVFRLDLWCIPARDRLAVAFLATRFLRILFTLAFRKRRC